MALVPCLLYICISLCGPLRCSSCSQCPWPLPLLLLVSPRGLRRTHLYTFSGPLVWPPLCPYELLAPPWILRWALPRGLGASYCDLLRHSTVQAGPIWGAEPRFRACARLSDLSSFFAACDLERTSPLSLLFLARTVIMQRRQQL